MKYVFLILILCLSGCIQSEARSIKELRILCGAVDNKCYREEFIKDFNKFTLSKSSTNEIEAMTEGDEAAIMVFKFKTFPTSVIFEMKEGLTTIARREYFNEAKFISADGEVTMLPIS